MTNETALLSRRSLMIMGAAGAASTLLPSAIGRDKAFAANASPQGQIVLAFSQEPVNFNPWMPRIEVDEGVHYTIFDTLVDFDPEGNLFPILAAEIPTVANGGISPDGLKWHVKLKEGVTWHDGKPFTAEDVKFSFELAVDPNFRSGRTTGYKLMQNITVISPTEITWEMTSPFAGLLGVLATSWIVPKHGFEGVDDKNTAPFNKAPIGTGPFKLKNRQPGDHIEFEANEAYHMEGPYFKTLIMKYIPDMNVMYTQFKSGAIDVLGLQWITPDNYAEAKDLPGMLVQVVGSSSFESMGLNMLRPQFQDPAVRKALYAAIDKTSIIDALYYGIPSPTETYMPQKSAYFNTELPKHEYNIEAANKLLDEAGWVRGGDGIRTKDGVRLEFTNSTTSGNHLREQVQQFLQQSFSEIGVKMEISNLPAAVMWGDYWMKSEFDTVIVGLNVLMGADPDTSDFFLSTSSAARGGNGQNNFCYQSEEVDRLHKLGAETFVFEDRIPIYQKIQAQIREDLPFLPIFQYANVRARKEKVTGPVGNPNNRVDTWNVRDWKI